MNHGPNATQMGCAIIAAVISAASTVKARMCPARRMRYGAPKQPITKPM